MTFDIQFQNVTFNYAGASQPALKNINLTVKPGEIVLVTGPSGSGKTTLCSCINGLIPHFHEGELQGEVKVRQYSTRKTRIGGLASLVGMVFQDPESQIVTNSTADEVAFGPENFGVSREEIIQRVQDALRATRLEGYDERDPYNLSGGEQQACVIAAVYASQPEIYVMDEPLANLDPAARTQVLGLIVKVAKERGKTLVIVEHALEEAIPFVDRIVVMQQGAIVRDGTVAEVYAAGDLPQTFTRPFLARLSEKFLNAPTVKTPEQFYREFTARYPLGRLEAAPEAQTASSNSAQPIITVKDLSFAYNSDKDALKNVSLTIHKGEMVALLGRNGSGKTTLVRHMIGLITPPQGKVLIGDQDVAHTPTHILAQQIGFCFQNPNHQLVTFRVADELLFGLKAHNVPVEEHEARIQEALSIVDMLPYRQTEIFDLGKGQKQRLALASVLTLKPNILIIDEPTTGQDPQMAEGIFEIIKTLNERGTTVLMITHQMELAANYAQRAVVLRLGELTFDGPIRELMSDPQRIAANYLDLPEVTKIAGQFRTHGVPPWLVKGAELTTYLEQLTTGKGATDGN